MADGIRPPGNQAWVRNLAETLRAQGVPLTEAAELLAVVSADGWSGPAATAFGEFTAGTAAGARQMADIHAAVRDRVDGHSTFVHQLPHLWPDADAGERQRLVGLWRGAAEDVAAEIRKQAAELDRVGVPPPKVARPREPVEPAPVAHRWPTVDPDVQPNRPRPAAVPAAVAYGHRVVAEEQLFPQLLVGSRRVGLPWPRDTVGEVGP
ncbi:hypothetical protein [Actinokineospora inagensis]|uniref:hypothetical protein n=1 Tax=Actinokineospora inagensis TaxID=103730 RepID=UPI000401D838|nr:hypothetical protein [Actinokineospora inagensis]